MRNHRPAPRTPRTIIALKIASLAIFVGAAYEIAQNFAGATPPALEGQVGEAPTKSSPPASDTSLPDRYAVISDSGLFGRPPPPPEPEAPPDPPSLLGILEGRGTAHAILRTAGGEKIRLAVGEERDGVRLDRIGINRVVITFRDQPLELELHAGMGSKSLLSGESAESPESTPTSDEP